MQLAFVFLLLLLPFSKPTCHRLSCCRIRTRANPPPFDTGGPANEVHRSRSYDWSRGSSELASQATGRNKGLSGRSTPPCPFPFSLPSQATHSNQSPRRRRQQRPNPHAAAVRLSFSDRFRSESTQEQAAHPTTFSFELELSTSPEGRRLETIKEEDAALDHDESKRDDAETVAAHEAERRRLATAAGELRMKMSAPRKRSFGEKIKGPFVRRRSSSSATRWGCSVSGEEAEMVMALGAPRKGSFGFGRRQSASWTVAL